MACSKLEVRGHLLHKTGTPPKHFSRECMQCKREEKKKNNTRKLIFTFQEFDVETEEDCNEDLEDPLIQVHVIFWMEVGKNTAD